MNSAVVTLSKEPSLLESRRDAHRSIRSWQGGQHTGRGGLTRPCYPAVFRHYEGRNPETLPRPWHTLHSVSTSAGTGNGFRKAHMNSTRSEPLSNNLDDAIPSKSRAADSQLASKDRSDEYLRRDLLTSRHSPKGDREDLPKLRRGWRMLPLRLVADEHLEC